MYLKEPLLQADLLAVGDPRQHQGEMLRGQEHRSADCPAVEVGGGGELNGRAMKHQL